MVDVKEATIDTLRRVMEAGELTARALVAAYGERVAQLDVGPDGLHAVLQWNPDADAIAGQMDRERAVGRTCGPLHGIPVLLKDNIDTGDHQHTTAGALALADHYAEADAPLVTRLRQAGAVVLGKANLTEFANYMTQGMPGGYSAVGGQAVCPYKRDESPYGSSAGSAVAVAANLCAVAVGTETGGSILAPSQRNGIVGLKPTLGLVSRGGVVPISHTLDTPGPMARTVADAALLLEALAGEDPADPATVAVPRVANYRQFLTGSARGLRVGVNRSRAKQGDGDELLTSLRRLGVEPIDVPDLAPTGSLTTIMRYEFKAALNAYLGRHNAEVGTLAELIARNRQLGRPALRYGQSHLIDCECDTSGRLTEPAYRAALAERVDTAAHLRRIFDEHRLDAMVFLAGYTNLAPFVGWPALTVPVGRQANGLPVGCYLMSRPWDEGTLLTLAHALGGATAARFAPPEPSQQ